MKKKYCVDYKIGNLDWSNSWFDTKEERDLFIEELKATDKFKTKKYVVYLNELNDVVKVEKYK